MSESTHILLVEDNSGDARLVEELLTESTSTYTVETVSRLADGIERLRSGGGPIDAVLLDLGLPDSLGLETLRAMCDAAPGTAIVVLTGMDDDVVGLDAVRLGAQDYLTKGRLSAESLRRVIGYARERTRGEEALRQSQAMRDVAEQVAGVGSWTWHLATQKTVWSPGMFRLWDVDPDDFDGDVMPILAKRVHPGDLPSLLETTATVAKTGEPLPVEYRLILGDGTERVVASEAKAERKPDGSVDTITGYYQDVTERRRAERALRTSQNFLDSVVEHSPHSLWISDAHGTLIRLNKACRDLLQITDDEVIGKYNVLADNIVEEQGHMPAVRRVFEAGETARFMLHYPSERLRGVDLAHSVDLQLEVTMSPVLDESGAVAHAIIQHIDVTDRVRAEAARRRSEERLRRFYDAGLVGVIFWTGDGLITDANDSFLETVGYTRAELEAGKVDWVTITPPGFAEIDERAMTDLRNTGVTAAPFEKEYVRKDGVRVPVILACATTDEARSQGVGFVLDITERKAAEEAAIESERQYHSLFEHMLEGFAHCEMVFDDEGRPDDFIYLAVNPAFERLTGFADVVGKRVSEVIPGIKTETPELFDIYGAVVTSGEPAEFEIDFTPLGKILHISATRSEEGRFVAVFNDVTERRRTEAVEREAEALRRSEELYREMFDGHTAAMFLADPRTGALERANLAAAELFGIPVERLTEMNIADLSASPADRLAAELEDAAAGGGVFMDVVRTANGSLRNVEVRRAPITLGTRTLLYAILSDITERTQAEQALRDSERQLAEAQRIAHVGSWDWDPATDTTTRSQETCRLFGRSPAEVGTDPDVWLDYLHPADRERVLMVTERAEVDGDPYVVDYRVIWPDGSERVARERGESVRDESGRVVTMFGTVQDITDQRHIENELKRRADELEAFNRSMVDREMRVIEMKEAVNALSGRLGEEPPFPEVWGEGAPGGGGQGSAR